VAFKVPNSIAVLKVSGQSDCGADGNSEINLVAGTNVTLTTTPATNSVTIAASGGGGGTPYIQRGWSGQARVLSNSVLYAPSVPGSNQWVNSWVGIASITDTSFSSSAANSGYYGNQWIIPVDSTLTEFRAQMYMSAASDAFKCRLWQGTITDGTGAVTWTERATLSTTTGVGNKVLSQTGLSVSLTAGDTLALTWDGFGTYSDSNYHEFSATALVEIT